MSSVGLKQGNTPQLKVLERSDLKKKKKKKKATVVAGSVLPVMTTLLLSASTRHQEGARSRSCLSGERVNRRCVCLGAESSSKDMLMISELRVPVVRLLFPASPRHVVWSLDPLSLVGGACSHLGSCWGVTIERAFMLSYSGCIQCRYWGELLAAAAEHSQD